MDNSVLPDGWVLKKLKDMVNFSQGKQVGIKEQLTEPREGYVRFVRIIDYTQNSDDTRYVVDPGERYIVSKTDIVMVRYGSPGLIGRGHAGVIANNLFKISIVIDHLTKDYLALFLSQKPIQDFLSTRGSSTMPALNFGHLNDLEISYPSILEQQRIVGILDKAFSHIATATAYAEKNRRNARELFDSTLNNIFTEKGEGWVEKTLESLSSKIGSGATPRGGEKSYKIDGTPLIRSLNVHDRYFKKKKLAFIDDEQAGKLSNVIVEHGDVLLNITGASVARCCIVPDEYIPARVNQHVSIIRINKGLVSASFLNYLLTSKNYKDELLQTGSKGGATRQAITKKQIEVFIISFPSLFEQEKVTEKLDALATKSKYLEAIYQQKLAALAELKQSLLQQAFAGEL